MLRTQSDTWRQQLNPVFVVRHLWHHRDLIVQMTLREVGQRYRGSFLGAAWSVITPVLMLAVYTFVFSMVFRSRWQSEIETPPSQYALILFSGLAAFNLFSEVVGRAPTLIMNHPNYVKKVVFPLEVLPVVVTGSALVNSAVVAGLVILGNLLVVGKVPASVIFLPLAYVPLVLLTLGIAWFLASLGVYIRDIGQGIAVVLQMLFFLSPILFPVSAVPERLQALMYVNPLTSIVESFRQLLVFDGLISWPTWVAWVLVTGVVASAGYFWFIRSKHGFADVL